MPSFSKAAVAISQGGTGATNSLTLDTRPLPQYTSHSTTSPTNDSFLTPPLKHNLTVDGDLPPTLESEALFSDGVADQLLADAAVPAILQRGLLLTKLSEKRTLKRVLVRVDPDQGQIVYESGEDLEARVIPIEAIREIRMGADAMASLAKGKPLEDDHDLASPMAATFPLVHTPITDVDLCQLFCDTLRKLHAVRLELMNGLGNIAVREAMWERIVWKEGDVGSSDDLRMEWMEVLALCTKLNVSMGREELMNLFKQADKANKSYLTFAEFRQFLKLLKKRPEVKRLYKHSLPSADGPPEDAFDFCAFTLFMCDMQKSPLRDDDLRMLFDKYSTAGGASHPHTMSLAAFTSFLLSPANAALTSMVYQDMTRPLPEYYISSSHNTYLVGHQLVGTSTTEGYIRALLSGCRSVEVDIYDGDVEPMIFHGKTLTTKVSLRAVCRSIARYGFVASPYPIIISAELHIQTLEQQDMMANIMLEEFGDSLIRMPPDGPPKLEHLPSPEELKGKVMLKTKNLNLATHGSLGDGDFSEVDTSYSSLSASESDVFLNDTPNRGKKRRASDSNKGFGAELQRARDTVLQRVRSRGKSSSAPSPPQIRPSSSSGANNSSSLAAAAMRYERPKLKMSCALAALLVYTVGVKCRGINKKEQYAVEHMFSLSENTINKMLKEVTYGGYDDDPDKLTDTGGVGRGGMMDLIKHCRTHLVRTYPKGMRVDSSNYEPHRYWSAGAQLVAINWQTCDVGFMINHAMFQRNGRCGYVLKPLALRSAAHKHLLSKRTNHYLDVTIISAQQLPRPKDGKTVVDPYVEVSIHVPDWTHQPFLPSPQVKADDKQSKSAEDLPTYSPPSGPTATMATRARKISSATSVVRHNGFNPVWEEQLRLPFDCVGDMKELIFLKFAVKQEGKGGDDDEVLAVFCASLGSLQRVGYRHIPLHDVQLSQFLFATLFVRIEIQDVPN
ncbi:hypothetical protein PLEOSDRAFT_1034074 [Pleurotus ostreatus PC15]|uniref:Phosphoinositide phospholipase C n=1 Tax=Pleurotus ostreatus (strain PC15) TaxID=1137138 RepID=A0A067NXA8_PLEO1|nr:hypothetical protein PLEOSDRAFT_1034074 [Pleurotus ostreatus PC15]